MEAESLSPGAYEITQTVVCNNNDNSEDFFGLRISSIFVIFIGSLLGAIYPIVASRYPNIQGQRRALFFVKYFGSGVIVATAFIHLLAPANEALTNPCLNDTVTSYPWAQGISLMAVFSLFLVELLASSFATLAPAEPLDDQGIPTYAKAQRESLPGEDHLGHARTHQESEAITAEQGPESKRSRGSGDLIATEAPITKSVGPIESKTKDEEKQIPHGEDYASQLVSLFIFEFGVIFHSVIIGLTLAVTGEEFTTLYIVLVFHQTFEGLALGSRLAVVRFAKHRWTTPYLMAFAYSLSTPLAIGIGIAARSSYSPGSNKALLLSGIFDATSSGILLYTGLIELMAHEFLFSSTFRPLKRGMRRRLFAAYAYMVLGAGLMALLGYWA